MGAQVENRLTPTNTNTEKKEKVPPKFRYQKVNIIFIGVFHLLGLYGVLFGWQYTKLATYVYSYVISVIAGFGVTGGVHRLWTHRSYKAKFPLRVLLAMCFCMSGMNTIPAWVLDHRVHHKFTETDADPHNAKRGFFFAHVGWLFISKRPEVKEKGKLIDMSDVTSDPVVKFFTRHFLVSKIILAYILPTLIPVYFWNESWKGAIFVSLFWRSTHVLNSTWMVNSAAHIWGARPYDKRIAPSQNAITSILAMGEGWHNYHHVFPWDYKASEFPWHINVTTIALDFFRLIGWAYDCKQPSKEMIKKVAERYGDGSHPHFEILPPDEKQKFNAMEAVPQYGL